MPLFHLHTFIALTIVLVVGLFFERATEIKFIVNLVRNEGIGRHRSLDFASEDVARDFPRRADSQTRCRPADRGFHSGNFFCLADYRSVPRGIGAEMASRLGAGFDRIRRAFLPARAKGFWIFHGVWSRCCKKHGTASSLRFSSFGYPTSVYGCRLALGLVGLCVWRIWKGKWRWGDRPPADIAFVLAAVVIFAFGYFVQTAPWDWDNLKLMVWGYFLILPFLWSDIIGRWAFPERAVTCLLLFGSGFVTLLGGLSAGHPGFGLIERARLDHIGTALRPLPRGSPIRHLPDLQSSSFAARPQSCARLPWPSVDGRIRLRQGQ